MAHEPHYGEGGRPWDPPNGCAASIAFMTLELDGARRTT
jgi:hypothetical protein